MSVKLTDVLTFDDSLRLLLRSHSQLNRNDVVIVCCVVVVGAGLSVDQLNVKLKRIHLRTIQESVTKIGKLGYVDVVSGSMMQPKYYYPNDKSRALVDELQRYLLNR